MIDALTIENFDENTNDGVCFIKFWTKTCMPCRAYGRTFEQFASRNDNIKCFSVDGVEQMDLSQKFSIRTVPTTIIMIDGVVEKVLNGALSLVELEEYAK